MPRPLRIAPLLSLVLATASLHAQFEVRHQTVDRRQTSVTWIGMSGVQRVTIDHSQPKWRPEYATFVQSRGAESVRISSDAWTTLHTNVELAFGDTKVPRGRWYLGLHRDAEGTWTLTVSAADRIDAEGLDVGSRFGTPDLSLPLRLQADAELVDRLQVALAFDRQHKQNVAITLAWGTYRLHADLVAAIDTRVHPGTPAFALSPKDKLITTASGLQYEPLRAGTGASPKPTDTVKVHYAGWLTDGTPFDSSHARGEPATFPIGAVVKGFGEGLQRMQVGATFRLTIPPELAYGANAVGDVIPANSTLVFVVTLLAIED